MLDYYNLLGVAPDAPPAQVRAAYRMRAKEAHPDAHPSLTDPEREALKRRFIQLAQAYEVLRDPARRARYDREREAAGARAGAAAGARKPGYQSSGAQRARPRSGPDRWRSTRATAPGGRPSGSGGAAPQDGGESLEDLLRDVEGLLGRFGLNLRQPFEELLDGLLDWAKALFRQVLESWEGAEPPPGGRPTGAPRPEPGRAGSGARAGADPAQDGPRTKTAGGGSGAHRPESGPAGEPGARAGRRAAETDLVAELEALRQRVKRRPGGPSLDPDNVEAELRALKERLRKQHPAG
jgi:curved DNA-binding protein CbpA